MVQVYWSCLAAKETSLDFAKLEQVLDAGIDRIHCDISDNTKSITVSDVLNIREWTDFPLDIHIATKNWREKANLLLPLLSKGDCLSIQADMYPISEVQEFYELMKELNCERGLAVMPSFIDSPSYCEALRNFDRCVVMAVPPGVSGMSFNFEALRCVNFVRENYPNCSLTLDGGVNETTISLIAKLEVDAIVSGSFISNFDGPSDAVNIINKTFAKNSEPLLVNYLESKLLDLERVGPNTPVMEVLSAITRGGVGMVVVDGAGKDDIGIISDGDLRRYLLKSGGSVGAKALDLCNFSPFYFEGSEPLGRLLELFMLDFRFDRALVLFEGKYKLLPVNAIFEAVYDI